MSKGSEDTSSECTEIAVVNNPQSFDAASPGNPREYPHKPFTETRVTVLHFCRWWSVFIQIFAMSSETHMSWNRVRNGRLRSSTVFDFGANRKRVCNFLLVIDRNCGPILRLRYDDLLPEKTPFSLTPVLFNALAGDEPSRISRWTLYRQN